MLSPPVADLDHIPVLGPAVVAELQVRPAGRYLDCTVGLGGHAALILAAAPQVRLVGIDQDPQALALAAERLHPWADQVTLWAGNFQDFDPGDQRFDGIVADLGVSSPQLDRPERGFSFRLEGPLDMRMNPSGALTAATVVNTWSELDLVRIFSEYGEERFSRRIARALVAGRPFATTTAVADTIRQAVPPACRRGPIHPATRVFQAIRIAVNRELAALETLLHRAPDWLRPAGRLGIISFHSLEDRRVKQAFVADTRLAVVTRKPIVADLEEVAANPRARSAKLRIAARLTPDVPGGLG